MNQFDGFRLLGDLALQTSKTWITKPMQTAQGFAIGAFETATNASFKESPQELRQSLFVNALIAGRWAAAGYPTISFTHRSAAYFATAAFMPDENGLISIAPLEPPFPAFAIRVPPGLFVIEADDELLESTLAFATVVKAHMIPDDAGLKGDKGDNRWWFKLTVPIDKKYHAYIRMLNLSPALEAFMDGISLWGFNQPTWALAAPDGGASDPLYVRWDHTSSPSMPVDHRADRVLRALLLGCCRFLSNDPAKQAALCKEYGLEVTTRMSKKRLGEGLPQFLDVDVRTTGDANHFTAVRDFIRHGGDYPQVKLPQE